MEGWTLVFLGVIALAALAQTAFLIALAVGLRRLAARVGELRELIDRDLRPTLEDMLRVSRNLAAISDLGLVQARRLDAALAGTLDKVQRGSEAVSLLVGRPLGLLGNALAVYRGLRSGIEVYRRLRSGGRDAQTLPAGGSEQAEEPTPPADRARA